MIKLVSDVKVTPNFSFSEFANSQDGNQLKIDLDLIYKLQKLRDIVGSVTITSGYRTPEFNKKVGGSSNSFHLQGIAADVQFDFSRWNKDTLLMLMSGIGFKNVGLYWRSGKLQWIHVDTGTPWSSWSKFRDLSYKEYQV